MKITLDENNEYDIKVETPIDKEFIEDLMTGRREGKKIRKINKNSLGIPILSGWLGNKYISKPKGAWGEK